MKFSTRIISLLLATVLIFGIVPMNAQAKGDIMYGIGFVNADNVKLRSQPSTGATTLDTAEEDECVVVISQVGAWYKVSYNLQTGYIQSRHLSVLTRENAELGYGEINGTFVNLRSGPGTSYRAVARGDKGDKVYIIGLNNGWYKVIFKDAISYIRSDYVDLTEIPYENSDSENEPLFFRLGKSTGTAPSAAALKAAEANKPEVKPEETVPEVTEPEVTEPEATEPEATEPEATEPEATEPEATEPEETKPAEDSKAAKMYGIGFVTASSGLRLRSEPNTTSTTLATASSNECIVIVSVEGSWYKVIYNLTEGYMHKDYLKVLTKENAELGYGKFIEATTSVYSGPAATYKVLDTAEKDEKAYIIGLNEGWYKVIFGDHIGYVSSDKLALTEIPYENRASTNYPRFFRLGRSLGTTPSADALNNNDTTIDGGSINGQTVVNKAKQYLGTPYVWGGTTPAGFDCSGFVYYVYNSLGYPLSRMITGMNSSGVYVPKSELKPGDIIIFANTYTTGLSHVGIYVGDGKFIHSPNSRSVVKIDDLNSAYYSQHYYSARRIYN